MRIPLCTLFQPPEMRIPLCTLFQPPEIRIFLYTTLSQPIEMIQWNPSTYFNPLK